MREVLQQKQTQQIPPLTSSQALGFTEALYLLVPDGSWASHAKRIPHRNMKRSPHHVGPASAWKRLTAGQNIRKVLKHKKNPPQPPIPPRTPHFYRPPVFLLLMAVVDDGRCRPYAVEWADAGPPWYGLPM